MFETKASDCRGAHCCQRKAGIHNTAGGTAAGLQDGWHVFSPLFQLSELFYYEAFTNNTVESTEI